MTALRRTLLGLAIAICTLPLSVRTSPVLAQSVLAQSVLAQESPAGRCPELLVCRTAEVNLQNYWSLPLTIHGQSACAQFCSADYWVTRSDTGAVLLQFGHGGALGPALLAWGFRTHGNPADAFELRTIVWVSSPNPQFIDDGWYEETTFTWDAAGEALVSGMVRTLTPDERQTRVREVEDAGLRWLFHP
jgi:hypothetical protein